MFESGDVEAAQDLAEGQISWRWLLLLSMTAIVASAAISIGSVAYKKSNDISDRFYIDAVCNRGLNSGLNLPSICDQYGSAPGLNLVSTDPQTPSVALLRRIAQGIGVNATSFSDTHIEISTFLESLSPYLTVGVGAPIDNDTPLTLDLNLAGINVSNIAADDCTIAGNGTADNKIRLAREAASITALPPAGFEPDTGYFVDKIIATSNCSEATNLYLNLPYEGYSICIGDNHTCDNDGTIDRSAILSGYSNQMLKSNFSTVIGGFSNIVNVSSFSSTGGGQFNEVYGSDNSFVYGGQSNGVNLFQDGSNSVVGGNGNLIANSTQCLIGGGNQHSIIAGFYSSIIAGVGNAIDSTDTSNAIIGGAFNYITNSTDSSAIISGTDHIIAGSVGTVILGGNAIQIFGSEYDNTAVMQNELVTEAFRTSGVRLLATATYEVVASDYILVANTTFIASTLFINVPDDLPDGMHIIVKDSGDSSAFPINIVTATDTLCPVANPCSAPGVQVLNNQGGSVELVHKSFTWYVINLS